MNAISLEEAAAANQSPRKPMHVHMLSLKLTSEEYRRLRRFVAGQEDRLGRRVTHQAVLEAALQEFLEADGNKASNSA